MCELNTATSNASLSITLHVYGSNLPRLRVAFIITLIAGINYASSVLLNDNRRARFVAIVVS
jgi:hypothetical protein